MSYFVLIHESFVLSHNQDFDYSYLNERRSMKKKKICTYFDKQSIVN
jgi:hypothetical protein